MGARSARKKQADYVQHLKNFYLWNDILKLEIYSLNSEWMGTELVYRGKETPAYEVWKE